MNAEEYRTYMDKLVMRAARFYGGAHPFTPDKECGLYCETCGAEQSGFNHRGQPVTDRTPALGDS